VKNSKNMNVLFSYFCGAGAHENLAFLLRTLARVFPQDTYHIVSPELSELNFQSGGNMHAVPVKQGLVRELTRFGLSYYGLDRLARERQADVIWSLNLGPYRRTEIPHVLSIHNAYQVYPSSVARYHPNKRFRVAALRYFFRQSLVSSEGVIVQTPTMADYVRKIKGAPSRIAVIPKSVESAEEVDYQPLPEAVVQRFEGGLGNESFTFFYAANSVPHKNHEVLISALEIMRSCDERVRVAVTLSEAELSSIAGDRARNLVAAGHLVPVGWVDKQHLRPMYDACDACVMPSLLESLSSAHLEAMQWSKPQISADVPYAHDLCRDATLFANPHDPAEWAAKMRMVMQDDAIRARLVKAGHCVMESLPQSWREVAVRVRQFLAELAGVHVV